MAITELLSTEGLLAGMQCIGVLGSFGVFWLQEATGVAVIGHFQCLCQHTAGILCAAGCTAQLSNWTGAPYMPE